jgi:hypothetical protein
MTSPNSMSAPLVRGRVARLTAVDACGMPLATASSYVTEGVITVNSTKNVDGGDAISQRIMTGNVGVFEPGKPTVTNFAIDINFLRVNPGVLTMLTGDPVVLNASADTVVGFEELALVPLTKTFALEVWTDTSQNVCLSGGKIVGYMLYPFISEAYLTIDNVADGLISCHVLGQSHGSPSWGKGPYLPVPAADGTTPARLVQPVDSRAHRHFELTPIAPPAATAGKAPVNIVLPTPY